MAGLWAGAGQPGVHVHVAQLCESEGQGIGQISHFNGKRIMFL